MSHAAIAERRCSPTCFLCLSYKINPSSAVFPKMFYSRTPFGSDTGCPRRNVRDFGRVFLMLNYTDITQKPISKIERLRRQWPSKSVGFWCVHVLHAVRNAILIHCACPAKRHLNAVTLANALQHGSSDVTR